MALRTNEGEKAEENTGDEEERVPLIRHEGVKEEGNRDASD